MQKKLLEYKKTAKIPHFINNVIQNFHRTNNFFTSRCNFLFSALRASSLCSEVSAAVLYLITWLSNLATVACKVATSCSAFWVRNLYSASCLLASPKNSRQSYNYFKVVFFLNHTLYVIEVIIGRGSIQ